MKFEKLEHASVCFTKAMEFQQSALKAQVSNQPKSRVLSKALFDLLVGRAECCWARKETSLAETLVGEAAQYLGELVDEADTLANIEYNFGLFSYRAEEVDKAIGWLVKSIQTRELRADGKMDKQKQSISARLAGVCYLSRNNFDDACAMLKKAEKLHHDPVGAYLLLKISASKRDSSAVDQMMRIIADSESSLDLCLGSIACIADAQWQEDAVNGLKTLFQRFESDGPAILEHIAPRYFESLAAIGRTEEAIQLLEKIIILLGRFVNGDENDGTSTKPKPTEIASTFQLWSSISLAAGSRLADRNDNAFAMIVLDKALKIAREGRELESSEKKDPLLENEATVCRLLASCAIVHASSLSCNRNGVEEAKANGNNTKLDSTSSPTRDESIEMAKSCASRALDLEPSDSSACLLLFRALILEDEPGLAAEEIQKACLSTESLDVSEIAEAACYAQDYGNTEAVLAALGCILHLPEATLQKNLIESSTKPVHKFFGDVFVSYIKLLVNSAESNDEGNDMEEQIEFRPSLEVLPRLHTSFEAGVRGTLVLGLDIAFGVEVEGREQSLKYLADVSWNCGKFAGERDMYDLWESFFDLSYYLHDLRKKSNESLESMRIARMFSAVALVESGTKDRDELVKANNRLMDAKQITDQLAIENDSFQSKILLIQAKCFIGMGALDEMGYCADVVCQDKTMSIEDMQQLAMIYRAKTEYDVPNKSESIARRNEMACTLLKCMVDQLLLVDELDIADLALTLRELVSAEIGRGEFGNKAAQAFSRAVGVITENKNKYPSEEVRWLAATGWDRAEMLFMAGKYNEAMRWADMAMEVAMTDKALQTYIPRIQHTKDRAESAGNKESCVASPSRISHDATQEEKEKSGHD